MMLDGGKMKETQVHLLLSSRAEMQKVIEIARQTTMSFMNFQPATPAPVSTTPQTPVILKATAPPVVSPNVVPQPSLKPQPPVITSNSLSGILAQQMYQQHQLQLLSQQQNTPLLTSTSVRHDVHQAVPGKIAQISQFNQMNVGDFKEVTSPRSDIRKGGGSGDDQYGRGRNSRSKSRERRDRRRSRSRDRGRRNRDRSRSRERRRKRRNRSRERSHGKSSRDRSYDRVRTSKDRMRGSYENDDRENRTDDNSISVWDKPPLPMADSVSQSGFQLSYNQMANTDNMSLFTNMYNQSKPDGASVYTSNLDSGSETFGNNQADNLGRIRESSCIRILNLDRQLHYSGIRKLFFGLHIPSDGIKIINDEFGRRIGQAVVRFARPFYAHQAMKKDQTQYNGTVMTIRMISEDEYIREVDGFSPRHNYNRQNLPRPRNESGNRNSRDGYDSDEQSTRSMMDRIYNRNSGQDHSRDASNNGADGKKNTERKDKNVDNDREDKHIAKGNDHEDDEDVMIISDSNEATFNAFLTLKVENLPPLTKEQDILKMFSDFPLVHIAIVREKRCYNAYVKFHKQEDAATALNARASHRIGHRTVTVVECSNEEYEEGIAKYEHTDDDEDNSRKLQRNVPPTSMNNSSNIPSLIDLNFDNFLEHSVSSSNEPPPSVMSVQGLPKINTSDPRMRKQQQQLNLNQEQQLPMMNQSFMGNARQDPRMMNKQIDSVDPLETTNCIFMSNLEYRITDSDIVDWFSDIGIVPSRVHLLLNTRGKPSGDCFCEFETHEDAKKALKKDKVRLKSRISYINLVDRQHVIDILSSFDNNGDGDGGNCNSGPIQDTNNSNMTNAFGSVPQNSRFDWTSMNQDGKDDNKINDDDEMNKDTEKNDPDTSSNEDITRELSIHSDQDDASSIKNPFKRISSSAIADELEKEDDGVDDNFSETNASGRKSRFDNAGNGRTNNIRGDRRNFGNSNSMDSAQYLMQQQQQQQMIMQQQQQLNMIQQQQPNYQRNTNGCVVALRNVPFSANMGDIIKFFTGFKLSNDDVIRRYRDDGTATGDARVCFSSPFEARRAIEVSRNGKIMNRPIHLSLL